MRRKTIAILGVDGSGKSTAVNNLKKIYGNRCYITYMGYKDFEDPKIEKMKGKRFSTPIIVYLVFLCFLKRYLRAIKTHKIVIFDRYVHEIFLNSTSGRKWINLLLYKYLFPMPSRIVYLHCSVSDSLKRKNDIPNADVFAKMKKRFDNYFTNQKNVLCLDTGKLSTEEITDRISQLINNSFSYENI